jgi:hypothetical protein
MLIPFPPAAAAVSVRAPLLVDTVGVSPAEPVIVVHRVWLAAGITSRAGAVLGPPSVMRCAEVIRIASVTVLDPVAFATETTMRPRMLFAAGVPSTATVMAAAGWSVAPSAP